MTDENDTMNIDDHTISIHGAGLSGLASAITLARGGYSVDVHERGPYPGARFRCDFQGLRNYGEQTLDPLEELTAVGLKVEPVGRIHRIVRFSPSHQIEVTSAERPLLYIMQRGVAERALDAQLARVAAAAGVRVHYVSNAPPSTSAIIATGPQNIDVWVYGKIYTDVDQFSTEEMMRSAYVFLDNRYAPQGYLYVLPGAERGEVEIITNCYTKGAMDHATLGTYFDRALQELPLLAELTAGASVKCEVRGTACNGGLPVRTCEGGAYYVGEAAGLQDPAAGFGMRIALLSGYCAASAIIGDEGYDTILDDMLGDELRFATDRARRLRHLSNDEIDAVFGTIEAKLGRSITIEQYEQFRGAI